MTYKPEGPHRVFEIPIGLCFPRVLTFPAFEGNTRPALFIFRGVLDSQRLPLSSTTCPASWICSDAHPPSFAGCLYVQRFYRFWINFTWVPNKRWDLERSTFDAPVTGWTISPTRHPRESWVLTSHSVTSPCSPPHYLIYQFNRSFLGAQPWGGSLGDMKDDISQSFGF